jgi:hypothetical protein
MIEQVSSALHFAFRQEWALRQAVEALKAASSGGLSLKKWIAAFVALIQALNYIAFEVPMPAKGQTLDLSGYTLVFSDYFSGDALDTEVWKYRSVGPRRSGVDAPSQIEVKDGALVITAEYLTDGAYGPGWYTGNISLRRWYKQGYFEIRCKVSEGGGFWSAFWIQAQHPYDHTLSAGGVGGAEIDVFEAFAYKETDPLKRNAVTTTIHCNGSDDDPDHIDSRILGDFRGEKIYDQYNTYGVEWTEDEYIFYINGVETTRSTFGSGVSQVPEEVIISLESPEEITAEPGFTAQYVVDYVKIYQKLPAEETAAERSAP